MTKYAIADINAPIKKGSNCLNTKVLGETYSNLKHPEIVRMSARNIIIVATLPIVASFFNKSNLINFIYPRYLRILFQSPFSLHPMCPAIPFRFFF